MRLWSDLKGLLLTDTKGKMLYSGASLEAQMIKNLPAVWEIQLQSLSQEDPLEKGMATHSSVLGVSLVTQIVKNLPAMQEDYS